MMLFFCECIRNKRKVTTRYASSWTVGSSVAYLQIKLGGNSNSGRTSRSAALVATALVFVASAIHLCSHRAVIKLVESTSLI